MTLRTRFTEAYRLQTPIAQAGMAFVGSAALSAQVSQAGALGGLGAALLPVSTLIEAITNIKTATHRPFHVNFITGFVEAAQINAVCEAAVPAVSFHWGHPPRSWINQLHGVGIRVFEQVGAVDDARRAVDDGVDLVVAQGREAGGHNFSTLPTFALVPLVVDAVAPALVLAAGGITDGRGLAAALMLGADGAWVGTRLVATAESAAHEGYKSRLVAAGATDTVRTGMFGVDNPRFNPMRVVANGVVREWRHRVDEIPADPPVIGSTELNGERVPMHRFSNLLPVRETTGDLEEMALPAGQGVGLVTTVEPAGAVIAAMTAQARRMLDRYAPGSSHS